MRRDKAFARACKWAALGIPTFPLYCEPNGERDKRPMTTHGHTEATVDLDKLRTMFKPDRPGEVRIGVYLGPAGYVAFDIDVKDGKTGPKSLENFLAENIDLVPLFQSAPKKGTPSGGVHYIFKKPYDDIGQPASIANDNGVRIGRGIDVRADGGYIADDETYPWERGSFESLIDAPRLPSSTVPYFTVCGVAGSKGMTEDDWSKFTVEDRNVFNWLVEYGGAHSPVIKKGGTNENGWYLMMAHEGRTARGCAIGGATNPGRVMVFSEGWPLANGEHLPGETQPYELQELQNIYDYGTRQGPKPTVTLRQEKKSAKSLKEMFESEVYDLDALDAIEPPEFLVENFLVRDSLAEVFADPGVGKSFLAIDWMMHIADGRDWHGHEIKKPEPVFYIIGEGKAGIKSRTKAWRQHHGDSEMIRRNVKLMGRPVNLANGDEVAAALPIIEAHHPALIVIDTLARASVGADGNGDKDMGIVVEHAEQIRRATGACVLVIHHTGHQNKERGRGSSAVAGALQTDLRLTRNGDKITLTTTKQKDHEEYDPHTMILKQVTLTGSEETSLVITPIKTTDLSEGAEPEEPEWMQTRLGDLYRALMNKSQSPQEIIPKGDWLDEVDGFESGNMFNNYKNKLVSMGLCGVVGEGKGTKYYGIPWKPRTTPAMTVKFTPKEAGK